MSEAPDPMFDPEGYAHWCERNACEYCGGKGEDVGDDGPRTCRYCDGSGIRTAKQTESV